MISLYDSPNNPIYDKTLMAIYGNPNNPDTSGTLLLQELAEGKKTDEETMTYIGLDHTQSNRVVRRYIYIYRYVYSGLQGVKLHLHHIVTNRLP